MAYYRVQPPLDAPATGEAILKAVDAVRAAAQGAMTAGVPAVE